MGGYRWVHMQAGDSNIVVVARLLGTPKGFGYYRRASAWEPWDPHPQRQRNPNRDSAGPPTRYVGIQKPTVGFQCGVEIQNSTVGFDMVLDIKHATKAVSVLSSLQGLCASQKWEIVHVVRIQDTAGAVRGCERATNCSPTGDLSNTWKGNLRHSQTVQEMQEKAVGTSHESHRKTLRSSEDVCVLQG